MSRVPLFKLIRPNVTRRGIVVQAQPADISKKAIVPIDPRNRELALAYYDKFYSLIYGEREYLSGIRPALLTPPQYFALPNPFTNGGDGLTNPLRSLGAFSLRDRVWEDKEMEKSCQINSNILKEGAEVVVQFLKETDFEELPFSPEYYTSISQDWGRGVKVQYHEGDDKSSNSFNNSSSSSSWPGGGLDPYMFEVGSTRKFPKSPIHESGCFSYLYVNGGSIAPVLAMDLTPSCHLLDICAGPGTKSLMALISSNVASLTCNDLKPNRVSRTVTLFEHYLGSASKSITHTCSDGRDFPLDTKYDKILVDVPCSNDRESLRVLGNNLFRGERKEERYELWGMQKELLQRSLKLLKSGPDSALVYSTCSLSPCENDGVVLAAISEMDDGGDEVVVDLKGLIDLLGRFSSIYKMFRTRTGVLIVPNVKANFGPMFISRLKKRQSV